METPETIVNGDGSHDTEHENAIVQPFILITPEETNNEQVFVEETVFVNDKSHLLAPVINSDALNEPPIYIEPPVIIHENNEELNVEVFPEYLFNVVADIARQVGFVSFKVDTIPGAEDGKSTIGIVYKVTVTGALSNNKPQTLSLFAKVLPTNKARRHEFGALKLFQREIFIYNEILPEFTKIQEEHRIKSDKGFYGFPRVYYANYDEQKEEAAIIMEDLISKGYQLSDQFMIPDFQHTRRLFIELGRFHATSFALRSKKPEIFNKFKDLQEIVRDISLNDVIEPMMQLNIDRALKTLSPHEEYQTEKINKLRGKITKIVGEITNGKASEPYSVLNHADCWINNIFYGYEAGTPSKIALIDWQVARYSSPALDILYYIFNCTDKKFRKDHYDTLLQIYYKSFREHLENFHLDANKIFPFTTLLRQLKENGKYGFIMSLSLLPMLTVNNQNLPNMDQVATTFANTKSVIPYIEIDENNEKYNRRMGDVIRDTVRLGYL